MALQHGSKGHARMRTATGSAADDSEMLMATEWSRRRFLHSVAGAAAVSGALTSAAGIVCGTGTSAPFPDSPEADTDRLFPQGIASGDPRPDGCLLWTRVEAPAPVDVHFQVAEGSSFAELVSEGTVIASPETDYTVRVRLTDLRPGCHYWYRFRAEGVSSVIGRTRTAPPDADDVPVTFAFASCQDYVGRWYHAWRALAQRADEIDFVLFLGDYIYEYERYPLLQEPQEGREIKLPDGLIIDKAKGIIAAKTLNDYREIYRVTRADADLKRIHQLCPFICIWDDHEHANDAWQDHAVDFNDRRGDEQDTERREAATRAWFEHLPVDLDYHPQRGFPNDLVAWRSMRWGRHVELFLTDQRYHRDDHLIPEGPADPAVGKFMPNVPIGSRTMCVKPVFDEREATAAPTMLGEKQRDWLISAVQSSQATWKLWGSALMVAQFVLDLRGFKEIPPALQKVFYFKTDQWDGFRTERKRILGALTGVSNLVVLSGDLHGFYAAHLQQDFDDANSAAVGVEFTVAGISSISLAEQVAAIVRSQPLLASTGLGKLVPQLDANLRESSPHFVHADSQAYGIGVAHIGADALDVDFVTVTGVREREWDGRAETLTFRVSAGQPCIERIPIDSSS